ncbi:hypothetical protein Tsubulata_026356 [Turnera subulata]|uniref:CUE domain-containing protein n=1 Tax=Turnera subulata TaxID=218843 RepID=A0A9Q0FM79_9ROSI|nr:hypothetical protein Tsubulata_026356 [Turnera subulata]
MSAGVCGKRVGFEEIFGSSPSSAKRSRCSSYGSPTRSVESGSESEDKAIDLLRMFPALDPELVQTMLRNHNNKADDAIESLRRISFSDPIERNKSQSFESATLGNCDFAPVPSTTIQEDAQEVKAEGVHNCMGDGSEWVDSFVQEMMQAASLEDARGRAGRMLEAFEQRVTAHSNASAELEHTSLKGHLQSLLNDNQILKRAVAIQHERNMEQEEKTREIQNLKLVLNQYQEQLRSLELSNYTLKLRLQREQQSSSIPGQFHPDVY